MPSVAARPCLLPTVRRPLFVRLADPSAAAALAGAATAILDDLKALRRAL